MTASNVSHRTNLPDCPQCAGRSSRARVMRLRRALAPILFAALAISGPSAHAHFLEDYYDAAGAQTARTTAGIYQSQAARLVTGGAFVVKVPRKDFTPVTIDAPHLKAGCGGIDLFLGAFSLPSRDEFVSFLRSVGTAMPGLAFQLALQSLSPDLNEQVTSFRDMIMKYTSQMSDSCTAAETLLDAAGASRFLQAASLRAANALRTDGEAADQAEAERLTRTDGGKVLSSVPEVKDSGGAVVEAAEMNLTWTLLTAGRLTGLSTEDREVMMTLLGTTLYTKTGDGENATVRTQDYPGRDLIDDLYGDPRDKTPGTHRVYGCDEAERCLRITEKDVAAINLSAKIYEAAKRYHRSITTRSRAQVTEEDLLLLSSISSIPLLQLVEAAASTRIPDLSDDLIGLYSQAAAYEGITRALESLLDEIRRSVGGSSARLKNEILKAHADRLEGRIELVLEDLRSRRAVLYDALAQAQSFMTQVEAIERAVYGRAAAEAASMMTAMPQS